MTVHFIFAQKSEYDLKHDSDNSQQTDGLESVISIDFGHDTNVIVHLSSPFVKLSRVRPFGLVSIMTENSLSHFGFYKKFYETNFDYPEKPLKYKHIRRI